MSNPSFGHEVFDCAFRECMAKFYGETSGDHFSPILCSDIHVVGLKQPN